MAGRQRSAEQVEQAYELVKRYGSVSAAARASNTPVSTLQHQLADYHRRHPKADRVHMEQGRHYRPAIAPWQSFDIKDGHVIVFSDAHFWPDAISPANEALLELCRRLKPTLLIGNGDLFDGASISRHDELGWEERPSVKDEIEAVCERMDEIAAAAPGARRARTQGNHDARFDRFLASHAGEMRDLPGMRLSDYLPKWPVSWAIRLNRDVIIKHRKAGGLHAAYNNTLRTGTSIVTGHLHRLCVTPWDDAHGRRWGVDTGTLADPEGPHCEYMESSTAHGASGFAVLTFRDGVMMPPELCEVVRGVPYFRGEPVQRPRAAKAGGAVARGKARAKAKPASKKAKLASKKATPARKKAKPARKKAAP